MIKRMLAVAAMLTLALSCAVTAYAGNGIQENNFDNGYQCSGWALDEVRQADFLGIFPESLRTADLTKPITRAEFAGVSVNTYIRMAMARACSRVRLASGENVLFPVPETICAA